MKIISLDLEYNQPSEKIIEIGAVCGNLETGEVIDMYETQVNPEEELNPRITTLTGITQAMVERSPLLNIAGPDFLSWAESHKEFPNFMTWGGGDSQDLRDQLSPEKWAFGNRWLDVKTAYIVYKQSQGTYKFRGGLAKSMITEGIPFKGKKHRALCDSYNTFIFYFNILKLMRGESVKQDWNVPKNIMQARSHVSRA